jgi:hypothetical protein
MSCFAVFLCTFFLFGQAGEQPPQPKEEVKRFPAKFADLVDLGLTR